MFGACQELMRGLYISYSEVTLVSKQCPTRGTYTASCVTLVLCGKFLSPGVLGNCVAKQSRCEEELLYQTVD